MTDEPDHFEALIDLKESLIEIDILCNTAEAESSNSAKYSILNKAALLLISGKFETFAESIADEFIFKLNKLAITPSQIPRTIRIQHSFCALQKLDQIQQRRKHDEADAVFVELGKLWVSPEKFTSIKVDAKFSYGKHGESEFIKLFEKLGIDDVFQSVTITEKLETLSAENPLETPVDFRGVLNSVCGMRNNILHEDASPNLNTPQVRRFRNHFENYAVNLSSYLNSILITAKST